MKPEHEALVKRLNDVALVHAHYGTDDAPMSAEAADAIVSLSAELAALERQNADILQAHKDANDAMHSAIGQANDLRRLINEAPTVMRIVGDDWPRRVISQTALLHDGAELIVRPTEAK